MIELASETSNGVPPVRINIPAIGLDTTVIPVGMDSDGAMAAPDNPDTVAWYALGPGLGVGGNVVLAGHVDWDGRPRAFGYLRRLSEGDVIIVWDQEGSSESYAVAFSHWVEADGADTEEIFAITETPTITLITCGGAYDPISRQYLHRLIVKAVLAADEN